MSEKHIWICKVAIAYAPVVNTLILTFSALCFLLFGFPLPF